MTMNLGQHDSGSGRHHFGEMTFGRLDRLPVSVPGTFYTTVQILSL